MARIMYLSMSNAKYSPNYFPFLKQYAADVASPGTEIELRGTRVGRIDSYRFFEFLDTVSILDSALEAQQTGFDAIAIGNILDPGLREARSMVDLPVLALGETCMLTASMIGAKFGLIAVNPYFTGRFEENVAKYGLRERLSSIECMGLTPHQLDECFSDEAAKARAVASFNDAARATMNRGAEVIIPAGGRLTVFLNALGIREVDGAPVLDGTATLIAMTEAAIRIRAASGTFVSRHRLYARAPETQIAAVGREYSLGYNLPSLDQWSAPGQG